MTTKGSWILYVMTKSSNLKISINLVNMLVRVFKLVKFHQTLIKEPTRTPSLKKTKPKNLDLFNK